MYEPDTQSLVEAFCNARAVFLDIGAAYGCMSLIAAGSGAKVYSYEPNPHVYRGLEINAALNRPAGINLEIFKKAVSINSSTLNLNTKQASTILSPIVFNNWQRDDNVEVIGLKEIIDKIHDNSGDTPNLIIKMDIEGAEWKILNDISTLAALQRHEAKFILALHPGLHRPPGKISSPIGRLKFYLWNLRNFTDSWKLFKNITNYCTIYKTNLIQVKRPLTFSLLVLAGNHEYVLSFGSAL